MDSSPRSASTRYPYYRTLKGLSYSRFWAGNPKSPSHSFTISTVRVPASDILYTFVSRMKGRYG